MSQIAEMIPEWTHYLTADEYFDRAVQTAMAYFKYPYEIWSWLDIYKWGMYNEWVVLELIKGLEQRHKKICELINLKAYFKQILQYFPENLFMTINILIVRNIVLTAQLLNHRMPWLNMR